MKAFMSVCVLLVAFGSQVFASNLETVEGKVAFEKGEYFLTSAKGKHQLQGLSLQQLRHYEGRTVKVAGEVSGTQLEIYKLFVKTKEGYEATYDWDVVNQDLYAD
ncbi:hypothetical protein NBRC116188_08510 [Oceaniserpentilla sp. 4NH20-0058]|uniref:hypothetical protein n=1 Tax=Oceaniserpentilla sp. 4NH20-0058 TaxID=3127660 RepID=UPI00310A3FC7